MNDRAVALLEQYEIEVLRTRKGRGAILCDTQQGCLILKEYTGREEQLRLQEQELNDKSARLAELDALLNVGNDAPVLEGEAEVVNEDDSVRTPREENELER